VTDYDKLRALLGEWGVPYENGTEDDGKCVTVTVGDVGRIPTNEKVTGYGGFYTSFEFSEDGSFRAMGAWE
jgi:hypothetical protein